MPGGTDTTKQESSSSSSSSSSQPSSTICNTYLEDIISEYKLRPAEQCPVCSHKVGFHTRQAIVAASSFSSIKKGNDGSKSVLPQWGTAEWKVVKPFIERFERVLIGDLVDESHWPRLLLKSTPNNNDGYWVKKYIVDTNKTWSEAKQLFADHFDSFAYKINLHKTTKTLNNTIMKLYNNTLGGGQMKRPPYVHAYIFTTNTS